MGGSAAHPLRPAARLVVLALWVGLLGAAPTAGAQAPPGDPTLYCEGNGGPLGVATDLEHNVLVGDPPLPLGVRTSRVTVDGVTTRVQEAGPAGAEDAVVFVHGNPGSSRDWDDLVAANGAFARTVAFDVSGYGKSDKHARGVQSTDGAAGYIQGLLERLGIRRVVLVVHDFGGPWGLQWAVKHPDALTGVVVINSGVFIDYIPHALAIIWATPIAGEVQMASTTRENFRAALQGSHPRLPAQFIDRMYDDYERATRCATLRYYRAAFQNPNLGREQAAVLRRRRRPALVVWGERDPFIPPEHAERQREAFPGARVEIFKDSGHWPFIEELARTRGLVVPFLRPRLGVVRPAPRAGQRRLAVQVRVEGVLPAHEVRARLDRGGLAGDSGRPLTVSGRRTLVVRLRRPLGAGHYVLTVRARGLPTQRFRLRVAGVRPAPRRGAGSRPRFTG